MKPNLRWKAIALLLICALLLSDAAVALPAGGVTNAQASGPGPNIIFGLVRTLRALQRRNRVYEEAGETAEEINAYYDRLLNKTRSIRSGLISDTLNKDIPRDQKKHPEAISAYVRIEAALEAERTAAIAMVEQEKNQARREFEKALGREITRILIASPGGQKIINDVRETIGKAREAAGAVQVAVEGGKPIEALGNALAREVGDIPIVQEAARQLGSMAGHELDKALGGGLSKIEGAINKIQGGMQEAIGVLDDLDASVAKYDEGERTPVSLVEENSLLGEVIPVERANAAVDVAAAAFAGAADLKGALKPGTSREDMRERIRGALLDGRLDVIQKLQSGEARGQTYCTAVGKGPYENAALQLGKKPEQAQDPELAVYLVCFDIQSQQPVYAKLIQPDGAERQGTVTPTPDEEGSSDGTKEGTILARPYDVEMHYLFIRGIAFEVQDKEVSLFIDKDGYVSGEAGFSVWYGYKTGSFDDNNNCLGKFIEHVHGSISGKVEPLSDVNYQGPITFECEREIEILEDCGPLPWWEEDPVYYEGKIRIVDGELKGRFEDLFSFKTDGW